MRAAALVVALTPLAAILAAAPGSFTRFASPKAPLSWALVGLGLAALALARTVPLSPPPRWEVATGGGLLAWGALSLLWSPAPGRGELALLLLALGPCFALLVRWTAEAAERREELVERLLASWLAGAALCGLIALLQRVEGFRLGLHRVTGSIGNPNRLAGVLLLALPAAAALAASRGRWRRLGWAGGLTCLAGLLASGCRSALLALAAMGLYGFVHAARSTGLRGSRHLPPPHRPPLATKPGARGRRRRWVVAWLLVAGLGGALALTRERIADDLAGRALVARVGLEAWRAHPLRGLGLGGFASAAGPAQGRLLATRPGARWSNLRDPHNLFLAVGGELGPTGLLLLIGLVVGSLARRPGEEPTRKGPRPPLRRCAVAAWIGLGVHGLFETSALLAAPQQLLAFGWLGLLPARRSEAQSRRWLVPALLGLAVWGAVHTGRQALADHHLARGITLAASDPAAAARGPLEVAAGLALDPAEPLFYRGVLAGDPRDIERSFALLPTPERATAMGNLLLDRGDSWEATRWFRRAIALHPRYTPAYNNLGVALLRLGQRGEARRYLERARSLRPGDPRVQASWRLVER